MMRRGLSMLGGWDPSWIRIILTPARSWGLFTRAGCWALYTDCTSIDYADRVFLHIVRRLIDLLKFLYLTCSCLMVSPPLPIMRPAFPAGMIISCMEPDCPLDMSWPLETMSSMNALALLRKKKKKKEKQLSVEMAEDWQNDTTKNDFARGFDCSITKAMSTAQTYPMASGDPVRETLLSGRPALSAKWWKHFFDQSVIRKPLLYDCLSVSA